MSQFFNKKYPTLVVYSAIVGLWLFLVWLLLAQNSPPETLVRYHITQTGLHALQIVFLLPSLLIWSAVLFAAESFYRYAKRIKSSVDSVAFSNIAYGLIVALGGMIVVNFISIIRDMTQQPQSGVSVDLYSLIVINNYLTVTTAVFTYWFLLKGTQALLGVIHKKVSRYKLYTLVLLPIGLITATYIPLLLANPYRTVSDNPQIMPTFALSDPLIVGTVALPYLIAWLFGLLTIVSIYEFQKQTPGIIYKKLFRKLTVGITLIITLTIVLQFITQFVSFWATTGLAVVVSVVAITFIILIVAYLMIASGARDLHKIETIGS